MLDQSKSMGFESVSDMISPISWGKCFFANNLRHDFWMQKQDVGIRKYVHLLVG